MSRPPKKSGPQTRRRAITATASLPKVLVTGFDAFDSASINPSWLVAKALHGRCCAGHRIVAAQISTVFATASRDLAELLRVHRPSLVVCLGLAGARMAISLERVAINVNDARIPDNTGQQPIDQPVVRGAPAGYFTSLPIKAMLLAMRKEGVAAEVSQTAGTFVCNHVFYCLMHQLATVRGLRNIRGGFIHLPCLPEQAAQHPGMAGMPLTDMVRAIRVALRVALVQQQDVAVSAGATQ